MDTGSRTSGIRLGSDDGFTLTELVVTIAILGALALVSAPRFFGAREFDDRFFFDDTWNALRHAQKLAVATGCGMISSTLLTLVVVPVFYLVLDDLVEGTKRRLRTALRRPGASGEVVAAR